MTLGPLAFVAARMLPKSRSCVKTTNPCSRAIHDYRVGRLRIAEIDPMVRVEASQRQEADPLRSQIHVNQELHFASGTSNSSERHAAYAKASETSSDSRYGYNRSTSSRVCPEASKPTIVPTVTRIPRMQGRPPITSGSAVMRVSSFIVKSIAPPFEVQMTNGTKRFLVRMYVAYGSPIVWMRAFSSTAMRYE
jgi:hypothetical protein